MRDPERIPRILKLLEKYWTDDPARTDLRLGQILHHLYAQSDHIRKNIHGTADLFYFEDEDLEIQLQRRLDGESGKSQEKKR